MPPQTYSDFFSPASTAHNQIDQLIGELGDPGSIRAADPWWNMYGQAKESVGDWLGEMLPPSPGIEPGTPRYESAEENIKNLFGLIPQEKWELPLLGLGMFPKGLRTKGLMPTGKSDLTQIEAWKTFPKSWSEGSRRGIKAYHSTPFKPIESDLKAGIHVGSPGAAIDRMATTVKWTPKYGDVASGFVHGVELYPKKPFTKMSPDFEDVVRDLLKGKPQYQHMPPDPKDPYLIKTRTYVERYLDEIKDMMKAGEGTVVLSERSKHSDFLPNVREIEKTIITLLDVPENRKKLIALGYDVVPYENAFEGVGSISFNVLNPKKAKLKLIDEVYTAERPLRKSGDIKPPSTEAALDVYEPRNVIETLEDLVRRTTP